MPLPFPSDAPSDRVPAATKRTLLVVDDEEGPRQSLWAIFKDDYDVILAESGAQALALARQKSIHAAVLDIRMPDMAGTDLLEQLKQIDPAIEVVMLTAYQTIDTARQALRFGACEYLAKPFDIETMSAAVSHAMERRAVSEQIRANARQLRDLQTEIERQQSQNDLARKKGEIYASILHDINNPLTVISGLIDMMHSQVADATRVEGTSLNQIKSRLAQTNRQLANCIQISRRYLSFLKPRPEPEPGVSVNQSLADLQELLRHHPRCLRHEVIIQSLPDDFIARINGIDLGQILLNLAVNAIECTQTPHRIQISGRILRAPLPSHSSPGSNTTRWINWNGFNNTPPLVELTVSDDGPGIPSQIIGRVFDPYFTTKTDGQGTGLGLSIVQRLVKQANGALVLDSKPGEGTAFRLYLSGS